MKRLLFLIPILGLAWSLNADPLIDATEEIRVTVDSTTAITKDLSADLSDLITKYKLTNAGKCALLVVGATSTGTVPIYFVPGPVPVSALQAQLSLSTGTISITNVVAGPDTAAFGKQLTAQKSGSTWTFILFGLNQTPIGPGAMAVASLDASKMSKGFATASLSDFVASDPNGVPVPLCVTTGVITK